MLNQTSISKLIARHLLDADLLKNRNIDTVILLDSTHLDSLCNTIAEEICS